VTIVEAESVSEAKTKVFDFTDEELGTSEYVDDSFEVVTVEKL
jgi:hypothetical protein